MVPMEVGDEDVRGQRAASELAAKRLSQHARPRATVENIETVTEAHFHAGSIASVAHVFGLGSRCRTPNSQNLIRIRLH